jgi:hypothetical protein
MFCQFLFWLARGLTTISMAPCLERLTSYVSIPFKVWLMVLLWTSVMVSILIEAARVLTIFSSTNPLSANSENLVTGPVACELVGGDGADKEYSVSSSCACA